MARVPSYATWAGGLSSGALVGHWVTGQGGAGVRGARAADGSLTHRVVELFEPEHAPLAGLEGEGLACHGDIADLRHGKSGPLAPEAAPAVPVEPAPQLDGLQSHSGSSSPRWGRGVPPTTGTKRTGRACQMNV